MAVAEQQPAVRPCDDYLGFVDEMVVCVGHGRIIAQWQNRAARPDRYGRLEPFAKLAFILAGLALAAGAAQWVWERIFN